jgi:pimeloyl-[acyl-carrier protein] methyl ester esterase
MPACALPDGTAMAYADEGAGEPVLLVHGWAAHGGFFADLRTRLARSHRVLTPTLRGHPGSGHGAASLTIETLSDDIAYFIEALGLESVTALGWSMGAMVLWSAAARLGPRLGGIIVEDMGPRLINDASWRFGLASDYGAVDVGGTLAEIKADWPAYVTRFAPRMFAPGAATASSDLVAWTVSEMSKCDPENMAPFWSSMTEQDFRGALARIAQPMLVIHGRESQVYPDGSTEFVAHAAPHARRIVIPGAGHVPHLEAPDQFFNHVEAFVRTTRQADMRSGGKVP